MKITTAQRLLALNHQFYQTFAVQFSATRQRLQPGVMRLLHEGRFGARVLDLGCGNAELAHALAAGGSVRTYTGLDFSAALLSQANHDLPPGCAVRFAVADLAQPHFAADLPAASFDTICAFAVLHHLPGAALREQLLAEVRRLLAPGGLFIHSNWQFMNSPRLAQRVLPWAAAGLDETELDPGDYLLDWRSGGAGLRYVHLFSPTELAALAHACGFEVLTAFCSDGDTGNLGLYQLWAAR